MRRNWLERGVVASALAIGLLVGAVQAFAQDAEPSLGQKYKTALNLYERGDYAGAKKMLTEVKETVEKENLQLNPSTKQEIDRRLAAIDAKLQAAPAAATTPAVVPATPATTPAPAVETPKMDPAVLTRFNAAAVKYNRAESLMRERDYEGALSLFNDARAELDKLPAEKVAAGDRANLDANIASCKGAIEAAKVAKTEPAPTMVADARDTTKPVERPAQDAPATPAAETPATAAAAPAAPAAPVTPLEGDSAFKAAVDQDKVRVQLEEQEIRTKLADGMVFLHERDFKRAEQKFLAAQLQVKYGDFDAAFKKMWLARIQEHLDLVAATQAQDKQETDILANKTANDAMQKHLEEMKIEQMRLKQRLAEQFNTFYGRGQYDDALIVLERMKALDPEDASISEKIKTTTTKKLQMWRYNGKVSRLIEEEKQYSSQQEEMTPWYPITKYPDNWKELSDRRLRQVQKQQVQEKPADKKVRQQLEETVVTFTFNEQPVLEAIDFLQTLGKVNIVVDKSKLEEGKTVTLKLDNIPLETAIRLLTEQLGLKWIIRDGVVFISDADGVKRPPEIQTYDVRDLLADIPNFEGPTFELQNLSSNRGGSSGGGGSGGGSIFSDASKSSSSSTETTKSAEESLNDLIELVKQVVSSGTWDEGSGNAIRGRAGSLVVTHTPETQSRVQTLLDDLRKTRALQVSIDIRFITITDQFLESVGFDFTGVGNSAASPPYYIDANGDGVPDSAEGFQYDRTLQGGMTTALATVVNAAGGPTGLGTAKGLTGTGGLTLAASFLNDVEVNFILTAVQQSNRSTLMNAPRLTMMNGQRAYIAVSRQQNFVQNVTAQVSEGAVGYSPDIGTVQDGIVFDVRPTVSADRRYVQMDLRPSVAVIERIDNFQTITTGLFGGAVVQLPVIDVTVVRCTVSVPDGGTLMIGGLNTAYDHEVNSGIPILSKIPILGKLFSRRGFTTERSNVIILVKPTIIIQEEHEADLQGAP